MRECGRLRLLLPFFSLVIRSSALSLLEDDILWWKGRHDTSGASRRASDNTQRLKFYISRHGLSCANAVQHYRSTDAANQMWDPALTECGRVRSESAGKALSKEHIKMDLVLSSTMLRAMETAFFQYPGHVITPVPFIGEVSTGKVNWPRTVEEQDNWLNQTYGDKMNRNMEWLRNKLFQDDRVRHGGSWSKFQDFLLNHLLPGMSEKLKKKKELNIAVVTHQLYIQAIPILKKTCKSGALKSFANNQVLEVAYDYHHDNQMLDPNRLEPVSTSCQTGGSTSVFKGSLVARDYDFCRSDFGDQCRAEVKEALPMDHQLANIIEQDRWYDHSKKSQTQKKPCCLA